MMIRLRLLVLLFILFSCTKKNEPFTFVQLCDTQLGIGGYEHDVKTFRQAVEQINELNPNFVVICGDLVHNATDSSYRDFNEILSGLKMPSHLAPGNHDVGNNPNDTTLAYYRKTIGDDYFNFNYEGYAFIVVNTQLWKRKLAGESEKQDEWFEEILKRETEKGTPSIVLGHYPLFIVAAEEKENYYNLPVYKRGKLLKLLSENNVVAYISGHAHKQVINTYDSIQLVGGGATSKNFDDSPLGFRLWEVSADTLMQHFVPLLE